MSTLSSTVRCFSIGHCIRDMTSLLWFYHCCCPEQGSRWKPTLGSYFKKPVKKKGSIILVKSHAVYLHGSLKAVKQEKYSIVHLTVNHKVRETVLGSNVTKTSSFPLLDHFCFIPFGSLSWMMLVSVIVSTLSYV